MQPRQRAQVNGTGHAAFEIQTRGDTSSNSSDMEALSAATRSRYEQYGPPDHGLKHSLYPIKGMIQTNFRRVRVIETREFAAGDQDLQNYNIYPVRWSTSTAGMSNPGFYAFMPVCFS